MRCLPHLLAFQTHPTGTPRASGGRSPTRAPAAIRPCLLKREARRRGRTGSRNRLPPGDLPPGPGASAPPALTRRVPFHHAQTDLPVHPLHSPACLPPALLRLRRFTTWRTAQRTSPTSAPPASSLGRRAPRIPGPRVPSRAPRACPMGRAALGTGTWRASCGLRVPRTSIGLTGEDLLRPSCEGEAWARQSEIQACGRKGRGIGCPGLMPYHFATPGRGCVPQTTLEDRNAQVITASR
jgi:hypothetical protein